MGKTTENNFLFSWFGVLRDQKGNILLSEKQILLAAEDFDVNQINPVKASRRNGMNYVFNGQHAIEIVAMVSGSRETLVWCMIYWGASPTSKWSYVTQRHGLHDNNIY